MKEKDELLEAGGSTTKGTAGFALSVFNLMNAILGKKKSISFLKWTFAILRLWHSRSSLRDGANGYPFLLPHLRHGRRACVLCNSSHARLVQTNGRQGQCLLFYEFKATWIQALFLSQVRFCLNRLVDFMVKNKKALPFVYAVSRQVFNKIRLGLKMSYSIIS